MSDSELVFYRPHAIARKLGISHRTIYRMVDRGTFPKPLNVNPPGKKSSVRLAFHRCRPIHRGFGEERRSKSPRRVQRPRRPDDVMQTPPRKGGAATKSGNRGCPESSRRRTRVKP